jgi:hypothetical protein
LVPDDGAPHHLLQLEVVLLLHLDDDDEGEAHSLLLPAEAEVEVKNEVDNVLPDILVADDLASGLFLHLDG